MREQKLDGKLAVVTGAGRGIGRAVALRLAQDGARVIVHCGASRGAADAVAQEIGATARVVQADLTQLAGVRSLVSALGDERIDILVNNAGIQVESDGVATIGEAEFDRMFAVNVKAPFFLVQALLDRVADHGRIVNISSGLSILPFPDKIAYGMTKAAINAFTRSLSKVVGARGITVNGVLPGVIATDMAPWANSPQGTAMLSERAALNRVGQPDDLADVVAMLAGPDARWMTGCLIDASGGANT